VLVLVRQSAPQTQLKFGFGGAKERLVHLRLLRVEHDISAGTVGVPLKERVVVRVKGKKCFELIGEHGSSEIPQRDLELLVMALEEDLDRDRGFQRDGGVGRHDARGGR
jgi:hypothetical protein